MPNDSDTLEKAPTTVTDWIGKFNKAKGWKPLKAPSAGKKVMKSPVHRYEEALTKATCDTRKAESALQQAKIKMDALQRVVESQEDPTKKQRAEDLLEEAEEAHKEAEAAYNTACELEGRQAKKLVTLTAVEEDLDVDLNVVAERVATLQDTLEAQKTDPYANLTEKEKDSKFQIVQDMRNLVARNIDKARAEVFKMVKVVDGEEIERSYAVICPAEYKILHAMLDEAMLIYLTGDAEAAKTKINATSEQLNVFRSARTGATIIEKQESAFDSRLSLPIGQIEGQISWLRTNGFEPCANALEKDVLDLRLRIQETQKNSPETVFDDHKVDVDDLTKTALEEVDNGKFCAQITLIIYKQIATLRAMDAPRTADQLNGELDGIENPASVLLIRRMGLERLEMKWKTETENLKKLQTAQAMVNVQKMNDQLKGLQTKYDDFFKKNRKGEIRTIKDSQTQQERGVKKDKKIPREALNELEMKLLAAQQLLESDSIDALKLAKEYLDEVEGFETSVGDNSKHFEYIIQKLGLVNKTLDRLKTKYGAYEASRTVDLAARVEKFEGSYKSKDPKKAYRELLPFYDEAVLIKDCARACHAAYKECEKLAKRVKSEIKSLSKVMSNSKIGGVDITGYFGKFIDDLAEAQRIADERDEASLNRAKSLMMQLIDDVQDTTAVAEKCLSEGSRDKLNGPELTTWTSLREDATKGQKKENAREENKKKFDTERESVKGKFTKLLVLFGKLNLDTSELDVALKEIDGLKAMAKASGDYEDALERVEELKVDADRHQKTGTEMAAFKKLNAEAATKDCADKLRNFIAAVKGFDKVIEKVGDVTELKAPDSGESITPGDVTSYLDIVAGLVRPADVKKLEDSGKALQTALNAPGADPRPPREAALSAVRTLIGALQANPPLAHFRKQPFSSGTPELNIAMAALPRLEIKLLTAIPK